MERKGGSWELGLLSLGGIAGSWRKLKSGDVLTGLLSIEPFPLMIDPYWIFVFNLISLQNALS